MIILLMGVAGSGKTTIGKALAKGLHFPFLEGDALHSEENKAKMSKGIPLEDSDRMPWLNALAREIKHHLAHNLPLIVSCSALKASYRKILLVSKEVKLVYLKGSYSSIKKRLEKRRGHFFNPLLLKSQFDALEEPKEGIIVTIEKPLNDVVREIREKLALYRPL